MAQADTAKKKPKRVVLGLDISSSVVGVTGLDVETGQAIFIEPIVFEKETDLLDKAEFFEAKLDEIIEKYKVSVVEIGFEDFAKKFTGGKSSIKTILTLARFNGLVDFLVWKKFDIKAKKLNVRTIRKQLGIVTDKTIGDIKDQILEQVKTKLEVESFAPWIYVYPTRGKNKGQPTYHKCNYDMADSWVVAKATWLLQK